MVVGCAGLVRTPNVLDSLLPGVAVHLHDFLDTVCLRRIDKDPHYIVVIPQNIVRRPSYDDAGALIGDLPDDLILGLDRLLYHICAEVQVVENLRGIGIEV